MIKKKLGGNAQCDWHNTAPHKIFFLIVALSFLLIATHVDAQHTSAAIQFEPVKQENAHSSRLLANHQIKFGTALQLSSSDVQRIHQSKSEELSIMIPIDAFETLELNLREINVFSPGFYVSSTDGSNEQIVPFNKPRCFRGESANGSQSFVMFSDQGVMGVIQHQDKTLNIERLDDSDQYLIYPTQGNLEIPEGAVFL